SRAAKRFSNAGPTPESLFKDIKNKEYTPLFCLEKHTLSSHFNKFLYFLSIMAFFHTGLITHP
ncbi:MAG: hypothetical protein Q9M14_03370, partial [Mariprofundaceae bacterium]|nr:hypothetical protein [Mariprofundaceae bacterium]